MKDTLVNPVHSFMEWLLLEIAIGEVHSYSF